MSKPVLIASCSGGETSVMFAAWLLQHKSEEYDIRVVFMNTGHEREETLRFMHKCDQHFGLNTTWIEGVFDGIERYKVVTYETAYRNYLKNGVDPFEAMIAKWGIPNMGMPFCSRELKERTLRAFLRDGMGLTKRDYYTALGIRSDEPKRLNWERARKELLLYFAQFGRVTKADVNEWWKNQPFRLNLKSYEGNCILCWKKSNRKLYSILYEGLYDPEVQAEIEWLRHIEEKYGRFFPRSKWDAGQETRMFRQERAISDLLAESEGFIDFAFDERNLTVEARQLALWDEELDFSAGCSESCEAI